MKVTKETRVQRVRASGAKSTGTFKTWIQTGLVVDTDDETQMALVLWDDSKKRWWCNMAQLSPEKDGAGS